MVIKINNSFGIDVHISKLEYCTDNAAMIAWAGINRFKKKLNQNNEKVKSRWPLDKNAPFLKGPGLKI